MFISWICGGGNMKGEKTGEYAFWREVAETWASEPNQQEFMNIINYEDLPEEEYRENLHFKSRKEMLLGFSAGICSYLKKINSVKSIGNGPTKDLENKKQALHNLIDDLGEDDFIVVNRKFIDLLSPSFSSKISIDIRRGKPTSECCDQSCEDEDE